LFVFIYIAADDYTGHVSSFHAVKMVYIYLYGKWLVDRPDECICESVWGITHTHTHTTVLLLVCNMSGSTRVSRYQKGKTKKVKTFLGYQ